METNDYETLQENALRACHKALRNQLNVMEIYPCLNSRNLLTKEEGHYLCNDGNSIGKKIDYVIDILPRKQRGWWDELICCLGESTAGTAHEYLASKLANQLKRDVYKWQETHRTELTYSPSRQDDTCAASAVSNCIARAVPSGIALDMHSLVPDVVELDHDNQFETAAKRVKLFTQTSVDTAADSYKTVMENQIGLVSTTELVKKSTSSFSAAILHLLQLYVDNFRTKKRNNYSQLTTLERTLTQIIEDITECTEDIDMNKEKEMWSYCLKKLEKHHDDVKQVLYSKDTGKMAVFQVACSLKGIEAQNARYWISTRKDIIIMGYKYLNELTKMHRDNVVDDSIYHAVDTRVKIGDECLKAWIAWVDLRTKL